MSLFVYCDFFERVFLFGGHLGFCLWRFISLSCEMQKSVDNNAMELVEKSGSHLFGIAFYSVERDEDVSIYARARGVIKGDDVGIVVVLEELAVDGKNLFIVAEDIVKFAH